MRYNLNENGATVNDLYNIGGLEVTGYIRLKGNPIDPMHAASKQYVDDLGFERPSNSVKLGVFSKERLPEFIGDFISSEGNNVLSLSNTGVTPGTYTKVVLNSKSRVTGASNITTSDIPSLNLNKINRDKPTTLSGYGITGAVSRNNGVITGNLLLNQAPVATTDTVTKQYTDDKSVSGKQYQVGDLIVGGYEASPIGFLRCNGGEVSKTTYAALYAIIGDDYGTDIVLGSGKPWRQQYGFNLEQSSGTLGAWTEGPVLPDARREAMFFMTKNRVHYIGGRDVDNTLRTAYSAPVNADGTFGTWVTAGSLPETLCNSTVVVTKNRAYLLGGERSNVAMGICFTAVINPDGTLGAWTAVPSLPEVLSETQAIVTKNRIYLLGGVSPHSTPVRTVYTAVVNPDGTIGTWTTDTALPVPLALSVSVVSKNRIYLLGGKSTSNNPISTIYSAPINADGTIGTWTASGDLPIAMHDSHSVCTRDRVFLIAGQTSSGLIATVYTAPINADGTLGAWSTTTPLPVTMRSAGVVITSSKLFVLTGMGANTYNQAYMTDFSGGLNDYSPYYDGTFVVTENFNNFKLPDFSNYSEPNSDIFVKF